MLMMDCVAWHRREEAMARSAPDFGLIDEELGESGNWSIEEMECRERSAQIFEGMLF